MKEYKQYIDIYTRGFQSIKSSLASTPNIPGTERMINEWREAFQDELYNPLLLFFYSHSSTDYLPGHILNNMLLSIAFSVSLGLSDTDINDIGLCAFAHDFGMKEYINLFQKGHSLSESENNILKKHPLQSAEMFKDLLTERVITGITDIHEQVNGQGYPLGKTGIEISSLAKIVSICDVFEALTHPRNFRKEFTPYESIKMIISKKNVIFSDSVLKNFVSFLSIYPIGSLVFLNTGETGIVVASNPQAPTRSLVRVLLNSKREVDNSGKIIDLIKDNMLYISEPIDLINTNEILTVLKPRGDFNF